MKYINRKQGLSTLVAQPRTPLAAAKKCLWTETEGPPEVKRETQTVSDVTREKC